MSNSRPHVEIDEFYLACPNLKIMGKIKLSDEEGEKLWHDIEPILEASLEAIKKHIEEKFENVRVGYDAG